VSSAAQLARAAILVLLGLHLAWRLWLAPSASAPAWAMALFFTLPLLPAVVLALAGHRKAPFWGALAALLYFCHGVMEAWATPAVRGLALAEAGLAALLIVAASWDGLRRRFAGRRHGGRAV